jgi:hypothetical protein
VPEAGVQAAGWRLHLQGASPGVVLGLNEPPLFVDPQQGTCGLLDTQGLRAEQLWLLAQSPVVPEPVAVKLQQQMMDALGRLPLPPVLQTLPEIRDVAPVGVLQLSAVPAHARSQEGLFQARLRFDYAGHQAYWAHTQTRVVVDSGSQPRTLLRDVSAERGLWALLDKLGLQRQEDNLLSMPGPEGQARWLEWLTSDFAPLRDAGLVVHSPEGLNQWLRLADDVQVRFSGDSEDGAPDTSAWFDLSLGMSIDGQRVNILPWVPDILRAMGSAETLPEHLYLPDLQGPGFVKLPTAQIKPWLAMLMELYGERGHNWQGDALRLSRLDALRTAASLGEGAVWQGAHRLMALVQQMRGTTALAPVPPPQGLQATLRPYQQQGLNWLQFLRAHRLAGILADDMGLGKTLQTLAHVLTEKQAGRLTQPALIVAPVTLLGNWQRVQVSPNR